MKILKTALVVLFLSANAYADVTPWNSKDGIKALESSEYKNDFYELADYFQPQINPLYCGAATSVIILNAINQHGNAPSQKDIEVKTPKAFGGNNISFKTYSQETFFNDKTNKIKDRKIIDLKNITAQNESDAKYFDPGLTLGQLRDILSKSYGLKVNLNYVEKSDNKSTEKFRLVVKKVVADHEHYMVVNFNGKSFGLATNGHISPVVAYDQATDSVLVMDVAGHKNGWYWVSVYDLIDAMNTKDGENFRGYLIISK